MKHVWRAIVQAWRGTTPEAEHWATCTDACPIHGSASEPMEPTVPDMPRQRDVTVPAATVELAQHDAIRALLRLRGYPWTVEALAEVRALETLLMAPAAEVDE